MIPKDAEALAKFIAAAIVLERPLCCLDVEATGIHKGIDRIVQMTVKKIMPDGDLRSWSTLVNPGIPIPPEATAVHGIGDADVAAAPRFLLLAPKIRAGLEGCDLMAFNGRYDMGMFQEEFKRAGIEWEVPPILDPLRVLHKFRPRTLAAVYRDAFGEDLEGAHDSGADVDGMMRYFAWQLGEFEEMPRAVSAIVALFTENAPGCLDRDGKIAWRNGEPVLNFGQHAGKPLWHPDVRLAKRGKSFLQWMLDKDFAPDTKAIAREAIAGRYPKKDVESKVEGAEHAGRNEKEGGPQARGQGELAGIPADAAGGADQGPVLGGDSGRAGPGPDAEGGTGAPGLLRGAGEDELGAPVVQPDRVGEHGLQGGLPWAAPVDPEA